MPRGMSPRPLLGPRFSLFIVLYSMIFRRSGLRERTASGPGWRSAALGLGSFQARSRIFFQRRFYDPVVVGYLLCVFCPSVLTFQYLSAFSRDFPLIICLGQWLCLGQESPSEVCNITYTSRRLALQSHLQRIQIVACRIQGCSAHCS